MTHRPGRRRLRAPLQLALCLAPLGALAQDAADDANAQVLQAWQQQTGQSVWLGGGGQVEFHGEASLEVYGQRVSGAQPPALPGFDPLSLLTPRGSGDYARAVFQGDLRTTSEAEDTTYLQVVATSSDDRSVLPRYVSQFNSFQAGRAGPGYQIALGDVVAGFSGLSSNLGLRGALLARQFGQLTVTGFGGTVAESWEALTNRTALDRRAPRTRYLRDVHGAKLEYAASREVTAFATVQAWSDRTASAPLPAGSPAFGGHSLSAGARYATAQAQLSAELARSDRRDALTGQQAGDTAYAIDGSYRWSSFGLRAGAHDLGPQFASLAQMVAPGIRDRYVGADWFVTPQLSWSTDVRNTLSRGVLLVVLPPGVAPPLSDMDSVSNRLNYSVASVPGLVFMLSDMRNRSEDGQGARQGNDMTQASVSYAFDAWNVQGGIGTGRSHSSLAPQFDSRMRSWQAGVGRNFSNASAERAPSWNVSTQLYLSGQEQQLQAGGSNRSLSLGFTVSAQTTRWGQLSASIQRLRTEQPLPGTPTLLTHSLSLDWARALTQQWSLKAYARIHLRNHGDALLTADERVLGLTASYQW